MCSQATGVQEPVPGYLLLSGHCAVASFCRSFQSEGAAARVKILYLTHWSSISKAFAFLLLPLASVIPCKEEH